MTRVASRPSSDVAWARVGLPPLAIPLAGGQLRTLRGQPPRGRTGQSGGGSDQVQGSEGQGQRHVHGRSQVGAQTAAVCGEWNDWSPDADVMHRDAEGGFSLTVGLDAGRAYRFRYLLDGQPVGQRLGRRRLPAQRLRRRRLSGGPDRAGRGGPASGEEGAGEEGSPPRTARKAPRPRRNHPSRRRNSAARKYRGSTGQRRAESARDGPSVQPAQRERFVGRQRILGRDPDAHALKRQSRGVTIAGHSHRARSAGMVGRPPLAQPPHPCAELGDLRAAGVWSGRLGPPPCRYECCLARMQSPE